MSAKPLYASPAFQIGTNCSLFPDNQRPTDLRPKLTPNVTHGEITSMSAKPLCASPAFKIGTSCSLSPENERATNVAPMLRPSITGSMGACWFGSPFFDFEPTSAEAENCPFVRP